MKIFTNSPPIMFKEPAFSADQKKKDMKLHESARNLEALVFEKMLSSMRKAIPKSGLFDEGQAEEIYQSMMDQELGKRIAQSGGMGLSELIYAQLCKQRQD